MILQDIGMLAVSNIRSMSYLGGLLERDYVPSIVLVLSDPQNMITPGQKKQDLDGSFIRLLRENNIHHLVLNTVDVNSKEVIGQILKRQEKYFIYSGPGGAILKKEILGAGKRFLHIHSGRLPDFRGSTTLYYHILSGDTCGVSALFLEEKVDQGPVISCLDFPLPAPGVDIDYEYDSNLRAELLVKVIDAFLRDGRFSVESQKRAAGETYFIMHPVLRHIAKLKIEKC